MHNSRNLLHKEIFAVFLKKIINKVTNFGKRLANKMKLLKPHANSARIKIINYNFNLLTSLGGEGAEKKV